MDDFTDSENEPLSANEYRSGNNKIVEVQAELDDAINVARNNLHQVIDRGDRLVDIDEKAKELQDQAGMFKKNAKKTHIHFCIKQWKMICIFVCLLAVLGLSLGLWSTNTTNDVDNSGNETVDSTPSNSDNSDNLGS
eukprot:356249_1